MSSPNVPIGFTANPIHTIERKRSLLVSIKYSCLYQHLAVILGRQKNNYQ